jgi:hypothetical protein
MYKTVVYQGPAWKIVDNYARAALKLTQIVHMHGSQRSDQHGRQGVPGA